jgi:hypothetical protein
MQPNASFARYLNPWRFKRQQEEMQRVALLRQRDGELCRRCRRGIRFDLRPGHDQAPKIHPSSQPELPLEGLCLVHMRCNAAGVDHTAEVKGRVQRKSEAALFSKPARQIGSGKLTRPPNS